MNPGSEMWLRLVNCRSTFEPDFHLRQTCNARSEESQYSVFVFSFRRPSNYMNVHGRKCSCSALAKTIVTVLLCCSLQSPLIHQNVDNTVVPPLKIKRLHQPLSSTVVSSHLAELSSTSTLKHHAICLLPDPRQGLIGQDAAQEVILHTPFDGVFALVCVDWTSAGLGPFC